jgi:hypothetical protein
MELVLNRFDPLIAKGGTEESQSFFLDIFSTLASLRQAQGPGQHFFSTKQQNIKDKI